MLVFLFSLASSVLVSGFLLDMQHHFMWTVAIYEASTLSTTFMKISYLFYYSHSKRNKVLSYYGFDFTPHLLFTFNWIVLLSLWELVMLHQPHRFLMGSCFYYDCLSCHVSETKYSLSLSSFLALILTGLTPFLPLGVILFYPNSLICLYGRPL